MLLNLNKKPHIRAVPGTQPNQYGIIGKPFKPYKENIIEKRKRLEDAAELVDAEERELKSELLKINFFEDSNKKSKYKALQRTVDEIMNQRNFLLTERRNKLKQLLYSEEEKYEQELQNLVETPLERASRLRERAKKIKEEREREKQRFIEEKLDEKWRSECDDLRTLQSKYLQSEMRLEHMRQMEENAEKERQRMEEEAMYADLWRNDMLAKRDKEHNEAQAVARRNKETAEILKEQMQVLERQKEEEKRLRAENARLAYERVNIDKMEKQMAHQNKLRLQAARKDELDHNLRIKLQRAHKLAQQELALDLKLLEEALASYEGEERDRAIRVRELGEEGKRYRAYLQALKEEEKRQEKELDDMVDAEVERLFKKRLNQWKAEREAREKLLEDVLKERRQQVEYKMRQNEENQRQLELEKKQINDIIDFYKNVEREERQKRFAKDKSFENDLVKQMEYGHKLKQREKFFNEMEYQSCIKADVEYQRRLEENMKNLKIDRIHPIRSWSSPNYDLGSGFCDRCRLAVFSPKPNPFKSSPDSQQCKCPIVYN